MDHSLYAVWIEAVAHRKMGAQDCSREVELAGSHRVAAAIHQLLQWGWRMAAGRSQQLWQGGLFCSNTCVRIDQLYMACIWQRSSMHIDRLQDISITFCACKSVRWPCEGLTNLSQGISSEPLQVKDGSTAAALLCSRGLLCICHSWLFFLSVLQPPVSWKHKEGRNLQYLGEATITSPLRELSVEVMPLKSYHCSLAGNEAASTAIEQW